jgi:RNA polymerase sigma-70 factor (ECF subfamily)
MAGASATAGEVVVLAPAGRDAVAIVEGLRRKSPEAALLLFDRVSARVNRLVWRLLGADPEHDDVVHQVFVNALASVGTLREPGALDAWIVGVVCNTVRREIRRRRFRSLFRLDATPPDSAAPGADPETRMVARRFYAALERLGANERIAFSLRVVDGCPLQEVASMCGCSLAAAKRRIASATAKLQAVAEQDPVLESWMRSHRP